MAAKKKLTLQDQGKTAREELLENRMTLPDLVLKLLPEEAKRRLGNRKLTVRKSNRKQAFTAAFEGDKPVILSNTKAYDLYVNNKKIGYLDFDFERGEVDSLEYEVKIQGKKYHS